MLLLTLTGRWESAGIPSEGHWTVDLVARATADAPPIGLTDTDGGTIHPPVTWARGPLVAGRLELADGAPLQVPMNGDPALRETGWLVRLTVTFRSGQAVRRFYINTAGLNPALPIDVLDLIDATAYPDEPGALILGVPGGAAPLGPDGLVPAEHLPASTGGPDPADYVTDDELAERLEQALAGIVFPDPPDLTPYVTEDELAARLEVDLADLRGHVTRTDNPHAVTKAQVGLGNANNTPDAAKPVSAATAAALANKADLVLVDGVQVIPTSQLPSIAVSTAVSVANQAAMLALTPAQVQPGDVALRSDGGSRWLLLQPDPSTLASWVRIDDRTDVVTSVQGQVGAVTLGAADVGALSKAANLTDVPSPSSARTALGLGTAATRSVTDFTAAAHATDLSNPHGVTKAQVGLDAVPNVDARARSTHTGQQAATTVDETADRKWQTAAERTKLAGIPSSGLLAHVMPEPIADMPASAAEQTLVSLPIDPARIVAGDVLDLTVAAETLNTTGASVGVVLRVYLGGVLIAAAASMGTQSNATNRSGLQVDAAISLRTLSDQRWIMRTSSSNAGVGMLSVGQPRMGAFTSAVDLSTAKTLDVTLTWASSGPQARLYAAALRRTR